MQKGVLGQNRTIRTSSHRTAPARPATAAAGKVRHQNGMTGTSTGGNNLYAAAPTAATGVRPTSSNGIRTNGAYEAMLKMVDPAMFNTFNNNVRHTAAANGIANNGITNKTNKSSTAPSPPRPTKLSSTAPSTHTPTP